MPKSVLLTSVSLAGLLLASAAHAGGSFCVNAFADSIGSLLRQWKGPLTAELVRSPGRFGLGQVPERLAPDDTTTMVCGFCSTGCGLKVHLKDGHAINLSAETEYPVNLGMACPKDNKATIHSLGWAHEGAGFPIANIELLGSTEKVTWTQAAGALEITLPASAACKYAYALKLTPASK